jgi:hypothetical protein
VRGFPEGDLARLHEFSYGLKRFDKYLDERKAELFWPVMEKVKNSPKELTFEDVKKLFHEKSVMFDETEERWMKDAMLSLSVQARRVMISYLFERFVPVMVCNYKVAKPTDAEINEFLIKARGGDL